MRDHEDEARAVQAERRSREPGEALTHIRNMIRVLRAEISALVTVLPQQQQDAWLRELKTICTRMGIDPITGQREQHDD